MNDTAQVDLTSQTHRAGNAMALALRLAHAENALHALSSGQIDAIINADGTTYLMRPAQEQLRQSERRLQAMVESVADVFTVVSRAGVILSENRAVHRILGYTPEQLVGSVIFKLIHEADIPAVYSAFIDVLEGYKENATVIFRHLTRDGSYCQVEATLSRLHDVSPESVVFSSRPVTGRPGGMQPTIAESGGAQLPPSEDRFLAMLSHELRTPLTPVLLSIAALQEDERFSEASPTFAMIRRNIELQSRLLEELSDFAAVGQHKLRLRLESIDAHEAVRLVLEICGAEIAAAAIVVQLDLRAPDSMVLVDSLRLQQVMWNLVKNAVKFSIRGSSISIASANDAQGDVTLEFADQGIGITSDLLPLVFNPLQQGDESMQRRYGGLGLGLFIAKGLVEAHHGTLTVASEGLGRGATFRLKLKTVALTA